MNRLSIVLMLILSSSIAFTQGVKINSVYTYTADSDTCNAFLVCNSRLSTLCSKVNTTVSLLHDTVFVKLCYAGSPAPTLCYNVDTVCLGVLGPGEYTVTTIVAERYGLTCDTILWADTATTTIAINATGLDHINSGNFFLTPNPTSGLLNCLNCPIVFDNTYTVYDMYGQIVAKGVLAAQDKSVVDVSHLTNGMYYLVMRDNKHHYAKRFMKQ